MQPLLTAQHSPCTLERVTCAGNAWLPLNNGAIRGLSEKVLESYKPAWSNGQVVDLNKRNESILSIICTFALQALSSYKVTALQH